MDKRQTGLHLNGSKANSNSCETLSTDSSGRGAPWHVIRRTMYVIPENTISIGGAADSSLECDLFLLEASLQLTPSDSSFRYSESEHALNYIWNLRQTISKG